MQINWDWIGGYVDGEGYIGLLIKKNERLRLNFELIPVITISSTNEPTLLIIQNFVEMGKIAKIETEKINRKTVYCWYVRRNNSYLFANMIKSHLILKRETCVKFLELYNKVETRNRDSIKDFLEITKLRDELNTRAKSSCYRNHEWFQIYFKNHSLPKTYEFRDRQGRFINGHPSVNKGKCFSAIHKQRISESLKGKNKISIDKDELSKLYYDNRLSINTIAKLYSIGASTIFLRMKEHGLKRRSRNERSNELYPLLTKEGKGSWA